ncbi:MAG: large conductance mechanosensitive channel protein MscL [Myxococcales bacterium]|jgi:large conductance mechanosensitive channel|nr:large conductance mechanosensitive channel protein MscL [Myxococcales bacterium]MBL0198217.1 large conductance mechanosensitive channel protein MscL [Myxococcales bacterium]HQY62286.1 large conductance mechanosensitive channel protein MscL [Polyangiaceae bacterium]
MAFIEDFKKFAFKGNVVDLAVGVIIGGAFGKIVSGLVDFLIMPLVSVVMPSGNWKELKWVLRDAPKPEDVVAVKYGALAGSLLDFLVVALVLFIFVSKIMGKKDPPPSTKECPLCLSDVPIKAKKCKACTSDLPDPA